MPRQDVRQIMFDGKDTDQVFKETCWAYNKKYFNLFRSNYHFKHGGEPLNYRQEKFLMRKFWYEGKVAAFKIKNIDDIGFCDWAQITHDMYGEPETVQLINQWSSPLIPSAPQVVDKDVVLGWIQSNQQSVKSIVDWYIQRIAQVDMVINTNLNLHKMPFIIPIDKADKEADKQINDAVSRILNNELIITVKGVDPQLFKAVSTEAPYIIDKLQNYKKDLENDLKTYLGINNPGVTKIEQLQMSEVQANDSEVNSHDTDYKANLDGFCQRIKDTLGFDISVEVVREQVTEDRQPNEYTEAPGPKGGDSDED